MWLIHTTESFVHLSFIHYLLYYAIMSKLMIPCIPFKLPFIVVSPSTICARSPIIPAVANGCVDANWWKRLFRWSVLTHCDLWPLFQSNPVLQLANYTALCHCRSWAERQNRKTRARSRPKIWQMHFHGNLPLTIYKTQKNRNNLQNAKPNMGNIHFWLK